MLATCAQVGVSECLVRYLQENESRIRRTTHANTELPLISILRNGVILLFSRASRRESETTADASLGVSIDPYVTESI